MRSDILFTSTLLATVLPGFFVAEVPFEHGLTVDALEYLPETVLLDV